MADTETDQAKRDAAAARRQRIMEGAENRMDVVEGRASGAAAATGTSTTSSTSSKLAAMRKRRFKKKTTSETTTTTAKAEEVAPVVKEPAVAVVEETTTIPTSTTTANDVEGESEKKKQYMGVARMRRKILKEKQQQTPQTTEATTAKDTSKETTKTRRKNDASLPILMHMVTVFLLFWAGLDIGMQQHQKSLDDSSVMIHTAFAPRTDGGVHRMLQYATGQTTATTTKKKPVLAEPVWQDALQESDEFMDANADDEPPNLDPLFGVDLDKATAGPGIVPWAARQAVKVHRQLLQLLYYYPLRLFSNPPVLCLLALLLRQLVGKTLLGAQLPTVQEATAGGGTTDLLRMAQNFVTSFLSSSFPTAVSLYDAWGHLRSDMYVILCGLFCGLALAYSSSSSGEQSTTSSTTASSSSSSVADEL